MCDFQIKLFEIEQAQQKKTTTLLTRMNETTLRLYFTHTKEGTHTKCSFQDKNIIYFSITFWYFLLAFTLMIHWLVLIYLFFFFNWKESFFSNFDWMSTEKYRKYFVIIATPSKVHPRRKSLSTETIICSQICWHSKAETTNN